MAVVGVKSSIKAEFRGAQVWDKRILSSLLKIAVAIIMNSPLSFSAACGTILRQCGARIFSSNKMSVEKIQAGHYKKTALRAKQYDVVLVHQDSSSFNYTGHKSTKGLGNIGTRKDSLGILCHSAIVTREDGLPLGIIGQKYWTRDPQKRGQKYHCKGRKYEDKESYKWSEGLFWAQQRLPGSIKEVWIVADRESDVFEYLSSDLRPNEHLLVRSCQPRSVEIELTGTTRRCKLTDILDQIPVVAQKEVELFHDNRTITTTVSVASSNIRILPPATKSDLPYIDISVVYAYEECDKSKDPIKWVLLCFKRDLMPEEAVKMVDYYVHRWKIERLFYTLKTGVYNVEKLRFEDVHTLKNSLAFYSVIAWQTMYMTYLARLEPDAPPKEVVDEVEKEVLEAYSGRVLSTAKEIIIAIATLGGFTGGSKRYPYPGLKVLWIGIVQLSAMKHGWLLAKQHFKKS